MASKHVVGDGECMASIARDYGFTDWNVIWNDVGNQELRDTRDPGVLAPGDEVTIPDKKPGDVSLGGGAEAELRLARPGIFFRVAVMSALDGEAVKGTYELQIFGVEDPFEGDIKPDGSIEVEIPATAKQGRLSLYADDSDDPFDSFEVFLGHLDPPTTVKGAQARLRRLGYDSGPMSGELGVLTRSALQAFQLAQGLEPTGDLTDQTSQALKDLTEE